LTGRRHFVGPLERIDFNNCKGPKRAGVSLPSGEDGNKSSFRNVGFSSYLDFQTMDKIQKPVILSSVHHRQSRLDLRVLKPNGSHAEESSVEDAQATISLEVKEQYVAYLEEDEEFALGNYARSGYQSWTETAQSKTENTPFLLN
jgi:hypothetical protein